MVLRRLLSALLPVVAIVPALLLVACPGKESGGGAAGSVSATTTTASAPATSASTPVAVASVSASESASADPGPTASASASATTTTTATTKASTAATTPATAPTCGDKPLPACPLKAWMQANSGPSMSAKDFKALVGIFNRIATMAPPGYPNWASIAKNGAQAAQSEDNDGCKAACRQCHDQYKAKFKADYAVRSRKI